MRILLTIGIAIWFLTGCNATNALTKKEIHTLTEQLEVGDLLFRRGTGLVGQVVTSLDRTGDYSHVELVVQGEEGWQVINETIAEDGQTAKVEVKLIYGNGTEENNKVDMIVDPADDWHPAVNK